MSSMVHVIATLVADDVSYLQVARNAFCGGKFFSTLLPHENGDIDSVTANLVRWGTTNDIGGSNFPNEIYDNELVLNFTTSGMPPVNGLLQLAECGYRVDAVWYCPEDSTCGDLYQGVVKEYDILNDPEWVRGHIPRHIDDAFDISGEVLRGVELDAIYEMQDLGQQTNNREDDSEWD